MFRKKRLSFSPKVTLKELGEISGVSPATISRIENGGIKNPGYSTVRAIEDGLIVLEYGRKKSQEKSLIEKDNGDIAERGAPVMSKGEGELIPEVGSGNAEAGTRNAERGDIRS